MSKNVYREQDISQTLSEIRNTTQATLSRVNRYGLKIPLRRFSFQLL